MILQINRDLDLRIPPNIELYDYALSSPKYSIIIRQLLRSGIITPSNEGECYYVDENGNVCVYQMDNRILVNKSTFHRLANTDIKLGSCSRVSYMKVTQRHKEFAKLPHRGSTEITTMPLRKPVYCYSLAARSKFTDEDREFYTNNKINKLTKFRPAKVFISERTMNMLLLRNEELNRKMFIRMI